MLNDITPNSGRTFFVRFKLHGPIAGQQANEKWIETIKTMETMETTSDIW